MGFTAPQDGGTAAADHGPSDPATEHNASFGQRLGDYFASKNPIMGSLAQQVFGHPSGGAVQSSVPPINTPPIASLPDGSQGLINPGVIGANAQPPKGGGGLEAILKLIAG